MYKSKILTYIITHPNTWESDIKALNISIKKDLEFPYVIFNYLSGADFSNSIVQEARGIIIDIVNYEVVCWPFRKFGNYGESYADKIDWNTAKVQNKLDGSIIKYWWSELLGNWVWSTNSKIFIDDLINPEGNLFMSLIKNTPEYKIIVSKSLLKNKTYIFELVSPDNKIVINYPEASLWHIGTRDNFTGIETNDDIGIHKPELYNLKSLSECLTFVKTLNTDSFPVCEGFVVVDSNWNRIKIKTPEYLIWHKSINNLAITKERAYDLIYSDDFNFDILRDKVSHIAAEKIQYYIQAFNDLTENIISLIHQVRDLHNAGKTRKDIAGQIKSVPYAVYGYKSLDMIEISGIDIIQKLGKTLFLKYIVDYK